MKPVRSTSNGDGSITLGADGRPLEADDGAGGLTRLRPDLAGHPGTVDCLPAGQIVGTTGVGVTVD